MALPRVPLVLRRSLVVGVKPLAEPATEWGVVIAVCERPSLLGSVAEHLAPADLTELGPRLAFEFVMSAAAAGDIPDKTLIARKLRHEGRTDDALELFSARYELAVPEAAPQHARRLHQLATLRRIRSVGADLYGLSEADDPEKSLIDAQTILRNAGELLPQNERGIAELADEAIAEMDEEARAASHIATGLPRLDRMLDGGLTGGRLYLVGARPSVGKSLFATNVTRRALDDGRRVLFVSLEMSGREIVERMLVEKLTLDPKNISAMLDAWGSEAVQSWDLRFTERATDASIAARARDIAREYLDLVVIDYIQLLPASGRYERRDLEVGAMSRGLKLLALELRVPILVCAQLNRSPEGRSDKRPRLSDLRESGSLEQDADVVLLLHREVEQNGTEADMLVAKNRHGESGPIDLRFDKRRLRFVEEAHLL